MIVSKMTTYTRESLNKLNDNFKQQRYIEHTENIVKYITNAVVTSAKLEGKKEFINVVKIIEDTIKDSTHGLTIRHSNHSRQISQSSIDVYDTKQIDDIINKLKSIFLDLSIEYVESKDLRGNILRTAIRVNWD
jgi:nucleoside diphosphate kinase